MPPQRKKKYIYTYIYIYRYTVVPMIRARGHLGTRAKVSLHRRCHQRDIFVRILCKSKSL